MKKQILTAVLALIAGPGLVSTATAGDGPNVNAQLAAVRASTADFHEFSIAQGAGWNDLASPCVSSPIPGGGAMGFHYRNPTLAATSSVDPLYPEVLVYAPTPNGGRRLVAVEWVVARDSNLQPAAPTLFGQQFHLNPNLGQYGAWILHAWLWHHNPDGIFADFNKRVSCNGA